MIFKPPSSQNAGEGLYVQMMRLRLLPVVTALVIAQGDERREEDRKTFESMKELAK